MANIISISNGMLDYFGWKQDSSVINEPEFQELIDLSAIKSPEIYHLTLQNVFKDISNDAFIYPHKLTGLCCVILNLMLKVDGNGHFTEYCSADDLNACL